MATDALSAVEAGACPLAEALFAGELEDASSIVLKSELDPWFAAPPWAEPPRDEMNESRLVPCGLLSALDAEFGRGEGMEVVIGGLPSLESRCAVHGACSLEY